MKRPVVVWAYTILVVLGVMYTVVSSILVLANPFGRFGMLGVGYYSLTVSLVLMIPQAIFIYLFFMLRRSSLTWLYISFGLKIIVYLITTKMGWAFLTGIIAWVVWAYISNKKVDGQPLFT